MFNMSAESISALGSVNNPVVPLYSCADANDPIAINSNNINLSIIGNLTFRSPCFYILYYFSI